MFFMFSPCHSHSVILPESTVCVCSDCVAIATWLSGYCSICHGVKKKKKKVIIIDTQAWNIFLQRAWRSSIFKVKWACTVICIEIPSCALHKYTEKHPITWSLALQSRSERIRCVAFWSQCGAYKLHAAQHQYSSRPAGISQSMEFTSNRRQACKQRGKTGFLLTARQQDKRWNGWFESNIDTPKAGMWWALISWIIKSSSDLFPI